MKLLKKVSVLVVAVAMMLNIVSPTLTFAGTVEKGSLQINREGATYNLYKVLNSETEVIGDKEIPIFTGDDRSYIEDLIYVGETAD